MKILLVDDDEQIATLISNHLRHENYTVDIAPNGEYAVDLLAVNPYGLILLDVVLPNLSGVQVCQTLRQQGDQTPVLMLTGKDHTQDKVMGLDAGADDYLVKPFELDELTARVRALLRRNSDAPSSILQHGPIQFDPRSQMLTYAGDEVSLRPKEMAILELMLRYPKRVFEPQSLLDQLWVLDDCPGIATIKSHIRSLRKKFAAVGAKNVVETLYGKGYRLSSALLDPDNELPSDGTQEQPDAEVQPSELTQTVIDQTWAQVQSLSWQRCQQLQTLVHQLDTSQPNASSLSPQAQQETRDQAIRIAHQPKGALGSFGFQAASAQAQQVEVLLTAPSDLDPEFLREQVDELRQLLRQQMTDARILGTDPDEPSRLGAAAPSTQLLVISRQLDWGTQLQTEGRDASFDIQVCSPLNLNTYLLEQQPQVIVLELSVDTESIDLGLLEVLNSNYGEQVPILVVCESQDLDLQRLALERGATAIAPTSWSMQTLLAIVGEYMPA